MTVARALYSDLITTFTIGASTVPSTTTAALIITSLYKKAYAAIGVAYAAYSASAEHAVIDTENCKDIIVGAASRIANAMNAALHPPAMAANSPRMPDIEFTKEERDQICALQKPGVRFASREDDHRVEQGDGVS